MSAMKSVGKLVPSSTCFLLCDIQERFRPLIYNMETVIRTSRLLTQVSDELNIPLVITEQYPKVFGSTIPDAVFEGGGGGNDNDDDNSSKALKSSYFEGATTKNPPPVFAKKKFSMITPEVSNKLNEMKDLKSCVLFGIESHVCVQQTALDLLEQEKEVHIIVDGVSSMRAYDRHIALKRLENVPGCFLTTAQSLIFMLMESAEHPSFKLISKMVVENSKLPNEFNDDLLLLSMKKK